MCIARCTLEDALSQLEQSTISTVAQMFGPEPEERRRHRLENIAVCEAETAAIRDSMAARTAAAHPTFRAQLKAARKRHGL